MMPKFGNPFTLIAVSCLLSLPGQTLAAQEHVVSRDDLHHAIIDASRNRQRNLKKVKHFLASEQVSAVIEKMPILLRIQVALPVLNDQELDHLARQTQKIEQDIAAGALTNQELTYIVIALAAAVVVLVAVE